MQEILVFGAGGHGKVVFDILAEAGLYRVTGFVDPAKAGQAHCGLPIFASIPKSCTAGIVAIGDNWRRSEAVAETRASHPTFRFVSAIHPRATVARDVKIGDGTVVMAGAVINPGTVVGAHCIVNTGATIDHDSTLGDYSSVAPGATLGGNCGVGEYAAISLGAKLIHRISIGDKAVVGAGAVVIADVPAGVIAYGVPCKVIRPREKDSPYL